MVFIVAAGFLAGMIVAYGLFAYPARRSQSSLNEDLKLSKELLEAAQKSRDELKQQVADQSYQLKELEKDLAFERSKKS
ncbi:MAG: hypothetical protein V7785_08855 [Bermanella sp.]